MRRFWVGLALLAASAHAQQGGTRPDVTVVVTEHSTTADLVEVTLLAPDYPKELLTDQCNRLGDLLGVAPRGLLVYLYPPEATDRRMQFLKATFATNGIIDREHGELNIEPVLKAFAGAPAPHTIHNISLIFSGETPNENTVRRFAKKDVLLAEAKASVAPAGIEYSVQLFSQDASLISFPRRVEAKSPEKAEAPSKNPNQTLIFALFTVAAIAGGALVYLALLRPRRP